MIIPDGFHLEPYYALKTRESCAKPFEKYDIVTSTLIELWIIKGNQISLSNRNSRIIYFMNF